MRWELRIGWFGPAYKALKVLEIATNIPMVCRQLTGYVDHEMTDIIVYGTASNDELR